MTDGRTSTEGTRRRNLACSSAKKKPSKSLNNFVHSSTPCLSVYIAQRAIDVPIVGGFNQREIDREGAENITIKWTSSAKKWRREHVAKISGRRATNTTRSYIWQRGVKQQTNSASYTRSSLLPKRFPKLVKGGWMVEWQWHGVTFVIKKIARLAASCQASFYTSSKHKIRCSTKILACLTKWAQAK